MPLDAAAPAALETTRKAPTSAWYALAVLIIATVLGSIDKVILTLLTEPIRQTLSLSDTQLGLLQGAGIVLFTGIATCRWAGSATATTGAWCLPPAWCCGARPPPCEARPWTTACCSSPPSAWAWARRASRPSPTA
jgi:hypothetical protein